MTCVVSQCFNIPLSCRKTQRAPFFPTLITDALSRKGIQWKFIPTLAPLFGRFWERLIGMTMSAIKKVLRGAFITLDSLQMIIVEIEAMLNGVLLTYVSSNIRDPPM